jgi:hypothetical protein
MITTTRKSKFKTKVEFEPRWADVEHEEIRNWCTDRLGEGGRKHRWRFGWTQTKSTYYFKSVSDATMFLLRWSSLM